MATRKTKTSNEQMLEERIIRFFFKDKASLDAFVDKLSENKKVKAIAITAAVASLAGYGLHMATSNKPTPSITATNSVIIQNGAGSLNISNDAFSAALKNAVTDSQQVANHVREAISASAQFTGEDDGNTENQDQQ